MPSYLFNCEKHGEFEVSLSFAEYDELERDEKGNARTPCTAARCRRVAGRRLQLFGNISTSDDPSFGSRPGEHRNRELAGFDPDSKSAAKSHGFTGWSEREQKRGWEHAD